MSFFVAAWPLIKRLAPFIGGALVLLGAVLWLRHYGREQYNAGVDDLAAKWAASEAKAAAVAATLAQERQAATDRADNLGAQNDRLVNALADAKRPEVRTYYEQNPSRNVACLGADRLRDIAKSDAAAYAAAHATK